MNKKIKVLKNGPYLVCEEIPVKDMFIKRNNNGESECWNENAPQTTMPEPYCLCRCGNSKNKPYCDGEHVKNNFDGKETAVLNVYKDLEYKIYEGENLCLFDYEELCASLGFCTRAETVWDAVENSHDEKMKALAIQEAGDCAAGRLIVTDKKTGKKIEQECQQEISPIIDEGRNILGPLYVKGGIKLESAAGDIYSTMLKYTLCRCGESENMPFCDSSHLNCNHMKLKR